MPYAPPPLASDSSFLLTPPPSPRGLLDLPSYLALDVKPMVPGLLSFGSKRLSPIPDVTSYGSFARGGPAHGRWAFTGLEDDTLTPENPRSTVSRARSVDQDPEPTFIQWEEDGEEDEGWEEWAEQWDEEDWGDFEDEYYWSEYEEADLELEDAVEQRRRRELDENIRPQPWVQYDVVNNNVLRTITRIGIIE